MWDSSLWDFSYAFSGPDYLNPFFEKAKVQPFERMVAAPS